MLVKVQIKTAHPVLGATRQPGETVEIHRPVADDLVARGIAKFPRAPRKSKKQPPPQSTDDEPESLEDSDGLIVE